MSIEALGLRVMRGPREALRGLDFRASPGELTAIVGPNGAGKSTLLRALAGLLPAAAGAITLAGRPLGACAPRDRARLIAYLPQERIVHWALTARAVVALGRIPHRSLGVGESAADQRAVAAALAATDATHLADRSVREMSGGELARVLIARALAQEACALLADEPTAGLDPAHQLTLFARFAALAAAGHTIVVALHDLSLAARFCRRIVLLHEGRCAAAGAAQDVLSSEHLAAVYGVRGRLTTIDGLPVVLAQGVLP
jgi:iron complex transport system ATP-binding protein